MKNRLTASILTVAAAAALLVPPAADAQNRDELLRRIAELEGQLDDLRAEREELQQQIAETEEGEIVDLDKINDAGPPKITLQDPLAGGRWDIGGAIRANYVFSTDVNASNGIEGPTRGSHGGDVELDTFRINADYTNGPWFGNIEYRWYTGYNFFHTLQGGYNFENGDTVTAGLTRVPFGVGPYGPSNNWFFDQHYYVGLADDMDYGVKYNTSRGNWSLDLAYFAAAEPNWRGGTTDSARYSYDIIDSDNLFPHDEGAHRERHQANVRAVYSLNRDGEIPTDLGVSGQIGNLEGNGSEGEDSIAYAISAHAKSTWNNWGLKAQLTYYNYDVEYVDGSGLDEDLLTMGAYDFPQETASEGIIPSIAINYLWVTDHLDWLDSVNFYNDFSVILKDGDVDATGPNDNTGADFNDSYLNVLGAAFARGGWYIYVDWAFSNGNTFVGTENPQFDSFGSNENDIWQQRFNINLGYYF